MNDSLRLFGSAANITTLALGLAVLIRNPLGSARSISHHLATKRHYFLMMGLALTIFGAIYYAFIIWWFMPQFDLPTWLLPVLAVAFVAQMLVAWIPARNAKFNEKLLGRVHAFGGIVVAAAMITCLWALATSGTFSHSWQQMLSSGLAVTCSILYAALLALLYGSRRYLLIVESVFIAVFSVGMLILTWI